jgi:hypothetical protein
MPSSAARKKLKWFSVAGAVLIAGIAGLSAVSRIQCHSWKHAISVEAGVCSYYPGQPWVGFQLLVTPAPSV